MAAGALRCYGCGSAMSEHSPRVEVLLGMTIGQVEVETPPTWWVPLGACCAGDRVKREMWAPDEVKGFPVIGSKIVKGFS